MYLFGLSAKLRIPKDSRPFVRPCVTRLLENRSLLFSATLQLVRACKREKNVPVLPILAKNCPKLAGCVQQSL